VKRIALGLAVLLSSACSTGHYATVEPGHPAYVVTHHIAEGKGEGEDLPQQSRPPAPVALPPPPLSGSAPDPEPLRLANQWQYSMLFQNGAPNVERVEAKTLSQPQATARHMGRFALELWIGHELIERVRFDFPLIAAEERPGITRRPLHDTPSLIPNAISRVTVLVPASPRATRLVLVDRATEKVAELPWPPDREPSAVPGAVSAAPAPSGPVTPPPSPAAPAH